MLTDLGEDATPYCGGTELLLAMKLGFATYDHLVDLKRLSGLGGIQRSNGSIRVGAATTHYEFENSALIRAAYPELSAAISEVANLRVRSVGTLGGNLCFADPHSDPAAFLTAINATLVCQQGGDVRHIPAGSFITGPYETVLAPGELLVAIDLPIRPDFSGLAHLRMKLTERPVVTVTVAVTLTRGSVSAAQVVIGSAASTTVVASGAAQLLLGASAADVNDRADACAEQAAACVTPTDGGEASPDYLTHLIHLYTRKAVRRAFAVARNPA